MIKFSKDKVLLLHKLIAEETGGSIGLRDEALLNSGLSVQRETGPTFGIPAAKSCGYATQQGTAEIFGRTYKQEV